MGKNNLCVLFPGVGYTAERPLMYYAGKGEADCSSLRKAIYAAIDTARNRRNYDIPLANPLKKLYKERREEGDKPRFAQAKPKSPVQ